MSKTRRVVLCDSRRPAMRSMRAALVLAFLACQPVFADKLRVVYPIPSSSDQVVRGHSVLLMELALSKSGVDYEVVQSQVPMVQSRALKEVEMGRSVDIAWAMTSVEREQRLRPIRIPLDKGVLGWRLLLIQKKDAGKFADVRTLAQLKPWVAVQGHDWPDADILRANGLRVKVDSDFPGLFKSLERGQVDYFPRSFQEIWPEAERHSAQDLAVEQTLILRYPTALYFFVNTKNAALAIALETGLQRAIADGSFEKLFLQFYGDAIQRSKLKTRNVIRLENPVLPPETPLQRKELWFQGAS